MPATIWICLVGEPGQLRIRAWTPDAYRAEAFRKEGLEMQEFSAVAQASTDCDHLWQADGGRGSGGAAVVTCQKCGVLRKASDSPAWSKADGKPVITIFDEVHCKDDDDCDWPECDCQKRPKGGFACPICGSETPHHHTEAEVAFVDKGDSHDWAICRAVDLYREPRAENDKRTLADFLVDTGGMSIVEWMQAVSRKYAAVSPVPSASGPAQAVLAPSDCEWSDEPFTFRDEPGEHDPCYVVMPGGAMLPLNHHATPGVDIARAKFIVDACNMALSPDFPRAAVAEAMQDAWNTICTDTGCHPLDIERRGKELFFKPGHWADLVALFLSRSPSVPSADRESK